MREKLENIRKIASSSHDFDNFQTQYHYYFQRISRDYNRYNEYSSEISFHLENRDNVTY